MVVLHLQMCTQQHSQAGRLAAVTSMVWGKLLARQPCASGNSTSKMARGISSFPRYFSTHKPYPLLFRGGYVDLFLLLLYNLLLLAFTCCCHMYSTHRLFQAGFFCGTVPGFSLTHSASAAVATAAGTTSPYTWDGNPITVIVIIIQHEGQAASHGVSPNQRIALNLLECQAFS